MERKAAHFEKIFQADAAVDLSPAGDRGVLFLLKVKGAEGNTVAARNTRVKFRYDGYGENGLQFAKRTTKPLETVSGKHDVLCLNFAFAAMRVGDKAMLRFCFFLFLFFFFFVCVDLIFLCFGRVPHFLSRYFISLRSASQMYSGLRVRLCKARSTRRQFNRDVCAGADRGGRRNCSNRRKG